ncbi:MAG: acetate/propionate family kinase [Candidatus Baltobacteraceae bacterium]|jgi:acetate kinase
MIDVILTLNAGSSSIKFAIYELNGAGDLELEAHGLLEGMGGNHPHLVVEEEHVGVIFDRGKIGIAGDGSKSVAVLLRRLLAEHRLIAVGHRVVHGGTRYSGPVVVDDAVHRELEALVPLAPLHQPHNLAPMAWISHAYPHVPQVACFDTAFHREHPPLFDYLPLPRALHDEGVRRYGFHGLSYEYITQRLPEVAPEIAGKRVVIAHLGSGASMCATNEGKSVDCTLSFTGLGGLPMGTRCGELDPAVLFYLFQEKGLGVAEVERLLYTESGLKGLSGISNDLRDLEASSDPNAKIAIEVFVQRIAYALGGLASTLGGLDGVVFTAGIGEHSKHVRAEVLRRSAWLGFSLDEARNEAGGPRLTKDDSPAHAYVIPTNEELMIGLHTLALARELAPS